ncbi:hypothetical protein [Shimia sp. MMG029]|uniref:hypothetical protein n=1 Tax=Shimia sp. MMG029 TaxID=3021978 RepID=UPI0022FE666C|nr:hypothetical protein [Shimia sp. MMG029]MDA5557725.1 hypothetical protein [Shimia sp. MMG029]
MRVKLSDQLVLGAIDPMALRSYAMSQGWEFAEEYVMADRHIGDLYTIASSPDLAIILPASTQFGDYSSVVGRAIEAMSEAEDRDELQILKDIKVATSDVLRTRAPAGDESGAIAIGDGVGLFRNSHDLLLSAACAVGHRKRAYKLGKNAQASEYMKSVKLGQTEIGSFIVTLLSPVPASLEMTTQSGLWPEFDAEPFERQVTRVLAEALQHTQNAVQRVNSGAGIEEFEKGVSGGISANLCSAAAKLIQNGQGLDLSLTWSQSRKAPLPKASFSFVEEDGKILKEAARLLEAKAPRPDEDLTGFVSKLSRLEDQVPGNITLKAIVDNQLMSVAVTLDEEMYASATAAHTSRNTVTISGDLVREGQRWKLNNPRDLVVARDTKTD